MTTDERLEKLERELTPAKRCNRHLLIGSAACLGTVFAWAFFAQPGRLVTAHAEGATTAKAGRPTTTPKPTTREVFQSASRGVPKAQVQLGWMYYKGDAFPRDYQEAVKWFTKAAEQGDAKGQTALGRMYEGGDGVLRDTKQAFMLYQKAAEQGDSEASTYCGQMCFDGEGVAKDPQQAIKWYGKASEQGSWYASFQLGEFYRDGKGVPQDYQQAVKWFLKSVEQGSAFGPGPIKKMYNEGNCLLEDYKSAIKLLQDKAEQGNASCQLELAETYRRGDSLIIPQDYQKAMSWYMKMAEQGGSMANTAKVLLGAMYRDGEGVPRDYQKALKYFREVAEQDADGNEWGQLELGRMYKEGKGVTQDYDEAIKWFRKAIAKYGNSIAQKQLYATQELKWRKEAEQGDSEAQLNLGIMYEKGQGVTEDYIEAYKWYILSGAQGNEVATKLRGSLQKKMSAEQVGEAQKLAKELKAKIDNN